ncbi:MAG: hypothetical protein DRN20_06195 [Thermoplasmata archaeon]|nr:MAG: hypothetical protein DRN20_06195 [Thermoplasmata archaeon]
MVNSTAPIVPLMTIASTTKTVTEDTCGGINMTKTIFFMCKICGSTVKAEPPKPVQCFACGAKYIYKRRINRYIFAGMEKGLSKYF